MYTLFICLASIDFSEKCHFEAWDDVMISWFQVKHINDCMFIKYLSQWRQRNVLL